MTENLDDKTAELLGRLHKEIAHPVATHTGSCEVERSLLTDAADVIRRQRWQAADLAAALDAVKRWLKEAPRV